MHTRHVRVRVDGVAYSPHRRIDVEALGVDYYVISVYKVGTRHATAGLASAPGSL